MFLVLLWNIGLLPMCTVAWLSHHSRCWEIPALSFFNDIHMSSRDLNHCAVLRFSARARNNTLLLTLVRYEIDPNKETIFNFGPPVNSWSCPICIRGSFHFASTSILIDNSWSGAPLRYFKMWTAASHSVALGVDMNWLTTEKAISGCIQFSHNSPVSL